jgi:hypothetical protein
MKVLVKEKIAQAGVDILKEHFDVEVNIDMTDEELKGKINDYDAILVRSASKITADILANATRPKIIGRAGVGVDNIDVKAATQKGIVVANAPGSKPVRGRARHRPARTGKADPQCQRIHAWRQVGEVSVQGSGDNRQGPGHHGAG